MLFIMLSYVFWTAESEVYFGRKEPENLNNPEKQKQDIVLNALQQWGKAWEKLGYWV